MSECANIAQSKPVRAQSHRDWCGNASSECNQPWLRWHSRVQDKARQAGKNKNYAGCENTPHINEGKQET
eukprot:1160200-Pelagomonas_calceolata.AAC.6